MMKIFAVATVVVIVSATMALAGDVNTLQTILNGRLSSLSGLGMGSTAIDSTGFRSDATAVAGSLTDSKSFPFALDGSLRAEGFGEVLLAAATLKIISTSGGPQLDETIPAQYLPNGLTFTNPSHSKPLTLRMLLTHTSSLVDTTRMTTAPFVVSTDTATQDIISFGRSVFLSSVGGSFSVATDIWGAGEPGLASTHKWAVSNVALLTFVMQKKITATPTLVTSSQRTIAAYIQENIINALGLTSTFVFMPDGGVPLTQLGMTGQRAAHRSTAPASQKVEASYLSGSYMVQTSLLDMSRVFQALFLNGALKTYGDLMVKAPVTLPATGADTSRNGVAAQGLGVVLMDRSVLCTAWSAYTTSSLSSSCPFAVGASIPAFVSIVGASSTAAHFAGCTSQTASNALATASPSGTTTAAPGTVTLSNPNSNRCFAASAIVASSTTINKDVAATALHAVASESVLQSTKTALDLGGFAADVVTPDTQQRGAAWGVGLFGILIGLLLGILVWSYITEIIVTQAPLSGDITRAAYPYLDKLGM